MPRSLLALFSLSAALWAQSLETLLSPAELAELLAEDAEAFLVLHVEHQVESYADGHIPGAIRVAWKDICVDRGQIPNEMPAYADLLSWLRGLGYSEDKTIVVYDAENGLGAARAYVVLDYLGLCESTFMLDGQWKAWKDSGRPVSKDSITPVRSDYVALPEPAIFLDRWAVADLAAAKKAGAKVVLMDARPADQFSGTVPGKGVGRPGHIPCAANLFWESLLEPGTLTLLPEAALRQKFEALGANGESLVVSYCRTGVQASFSYFVARSLGYDVRLYDGSFIDWSASQEAVEGGP